MDNLRAEECYEGTPESTPLLPNDSGYITATPSTLCNDSPYNTSVNDLPTYWPTAHYIHGTPLASQKSGKLSSSRKHLIRENSEFENVNEHPEGSLCSFTSVVEEEDSVHNPDYDNRNGTLAECFSQLLVDETMCTNTITEVYNSCEEKSLPSPKFKLSSNSKKKSGIFFGRVAAKKFKQDISSVHEKSENLGHCLPRLCNYNGISRLDILVHLAGVSGNFREIISQILSYLSPEDLVTVCSVSPEWRSICVEDIGANRRRLAHLRHVEHAKENITLEKAKNSSHSLNISLTSNKAVFKEIQNTDRRSSNSSTPPSTPRSPPVSPSKVRFKLFLKAGVDLDEGTRLICCPRCSRPSQATSHRARCQAIGCQYNFCVFCLCPIHEGVLCPGHAVRPVRRKITCIGSKESRRNLRRL